MCLIIDNCVASDVGQGNANAAPLVELLQKNRTHLAYNRSLLDEYSKAFRTFLASLGQAGRAHLIRTGTLTAEIRKLMKSDDPHVIDLALQSDSRALCTSDKDLRTDFTNAKILKPKGRLYTGPSSASVVKNCQCQRCKPKVKKKRKR